MGCKITGGLVRRKDGGNAITADSAYSSSDNSGVSRLTFSYSSICLVMVIFILSRTLIRL